MRILSWLLVSYRAFHRRIYAFLYRHLISGGKLLSKPARIFKNFINPLSILIRYRIENRLNTTNFDDRQVGLNSCHVVVINLKDRHDRRESFDAEAGKIGLTDFSYFEAHKNDRGALGCSMSHYSVLTENNPPNKPLLMVCEDDCEFLLNRDELDNLIEEFRANPKLDVLCLAYNTPQARRQITISPNLMVSENIQTTAAYLLKPHMIGVLAATAKRSVNGLMSSDIPGVNEIDVLWKELQSVFFFAVPIRRAAKQIASYSDIEMKSTDYGV